MEQGQVDEIKTDQPQSDWMAEQAPGSKWSILVLMDSMVLTEAQRHIQFSQINNQKILKAVTSDDAI